MKNSPFPRDPAKRLARRVPLADGKELERGTARLKRRTELKSAPAKRRAVLDAAPFTAKVPASTRRETGFPAAVKLGVRTRAGNGDPGEALCEACGQWLGRYGGNIQHLVARGMGGTSNPVLKTAANAALLCGLTPQDPDGCHYLAECRHKEMRDRGFWLRQGTDPRAVPMTLHTGVLAWRLENGTYAFEAPAGAA